jgi:preprotein translocase subunit SecA
MAGRGTDIILGGNPDFEAKKEMKKEGYDEELISLASSFVPLETDEEKEARTKYKTLLDKYSEERADEQKKVVELGGLHIIGSERHESRRIDNQLRGRAGRQGDPGSTQFFISMEDELLRLFGGERMQSIVTRLGVEEDQPIEAGMLSRSIENAQKKVENRNFTARKYVLKYDNVMNTQREVIYGDRRRVLMGDDMHERILGMAQELIEEAVSKSIMGSKFVEEWDLDGLNTALRNISRAYKPVKYTDEMLSDISEQALDDSIYDEFVRIYNEKEEEFTSPVMRDMERMVLLQTIDSHWMDHIDAMDQLRHGIGLRAIGQQDPAAAYAQEGFDMFELMTESIKEDTVMFCYNATLREKVERKNVIGIGKERKDEDVSAYLGGDEAPEAYVDMPEATEVPDREPKAEPIRRTGAKVGRNDPCPCGSGKKYKNCCGKNE